MSASQRGVTTVADRATAKIARQAAAEAAVPLGGHVLRTTATTNGRSVEVAVELDLPLQAPGDAGRMAHLHDHLAERTRYLTGLAIAPAHIRVRKLTTDVVRTRPKAGEPSPRTARRPWSARRPAAAALGVAMAALSVLVLWTVLQQNVPAIPPAPWRQVKERWHESGSRSFVRPAAALTAAAAGGWLILLALTPGHRRALALGCPPSLPVRARITRTHAARLVRAAIAEVPGLRVRSVRFRPRKVTVRADVAFGATQDLREATADAVSRTLESMSLARRPRVRVVLSDRREGRVVGVERPSQEGADA
ncbi:DUF6286 domain-containing protein [Streptomyces vinaceus]|uniref:DUF6286 domain-containing protein n=1 Tax=Streptomyces vinaceus TaxID=1960 RepID=UPI0036BBA44D